VFALRSSRFDHEETVINGHVIRTWFVFRGIPNETKKRILLKLLPKTEREREEEERRREKVRKKTKVNGRRKGNDKNIKKKETQSRKETKYKGYKKYSHIKSIVSQCI